MWANRFLACALAQKACREGLQRLLRANGKAAAGACRSEGGWDVRTTPLCNPGKNGSMRIVLDDWAMAPLNTTHSAEMLFEIFDDRYDRHSTLVAAQSTN